MVEMRESMEEAVLEEMTGQGGESSLCMAWSRKSIKIK